MPIRPAPPRLWRTVVYPLPGYHYFERGPEFSASSTVGGLVLLKGAWMADAAMLVYGRSGETRLTTTQVSAILFERGGFAQTTFLGDWSGGAKGAQGFFTERSEFAVLAFRGTEVDDWRDLIADLRMHRGFQAQLDSLWGQASELVARYRRHSTGEIFFTGHSLGAALATLALARVEDNRASLYTFGSPRVGDRGLAERLAKRTSAGHFRIVDRNDIVTRVPPAFLGYQHPAGTLYHIEADGTIRDARQDGAADDAAELKRDLATGAALRLPIDLDSAPPPDLYDHGPGCYATALWNAVGVECAAGAP